MYYYKYRESVIIDFHLLVFNGGNCEGKRCRVFPVSVGILAEQNKCARMKEHFP